MASISNINNHNGRKLTLLGGDSLGCAYQTLDLNVPKQKNGCGSYKVYFQETEF